MRPGVPSPGLTRCQGGVALLTRGCGRGWKPGGPKDHGGFRGSDSLVSLPVAPDPARWDGEVILSKGHP